MTLFSNIRAIAPLLLFPMMVTHSNENGNIPTVEHVVVNGLDAYLINTGSGNAAALTFNVQVGSWHDEPTRHAGRAHLWEHVIHLGSRRYPGAETFDQMTVKMGSSYNAYTTDDRVFYHHYLHPEAFEAAADQLGAMVSEPEWNDDSRKRETRVVMDEAANYLKKDVWALDAEIFLQLLPEDHPLKMYDVGTKDQLEAMKRDDLKNLYYGNYVPGSVQIIVAGNFNPINGTTPPLNREQVIQSLQKHFFPADPKNDPHGFRPSETTLRKKDFPSIIKPGHTRFIEMGSKSEGQHILKLRFEADPDLDSAVLETLLDYINLIEPGSFNDLLKSRNWANGVYAHSKTVNHLRIVDVGFDLTKEGAEHRFEVVELFFSFLHRIRTDGLTKELVDYLRQRNVISYSQSVLEADYAAEYLAMDLGKKDFRLEDAFNYQKTFGTVTRQSLSDAVTSTFSAEKVIGGYVGADVQSSNQTEVTGRPLVFVDNSRTIDAWKKAFEEGVALKDGEKTQVELKTVPVQFSENPRGRGQTLPRTFRVGDIGFQVALQEDHSTTQGGIEISTHFGILDESSAAALQIFTVAFRERYKAELGYLDSFGLEVDVLAGYQSVQFAVSGNALAAENALQWLTEQFYSFVPTEEEIQTVKSTLHSRFLKGQQKMAAPLVRSASSALLDRIVHPSENLDRARKSIRSIEDVMSRTKKLIRRADVQAAVYGDYPEGIEKELYRLIRTHIPERLTPETREALENRSVKIANQVRYWKPLSEVKGEEEQGLARTYAGPSLNSWEEVALVVLQNALSDAAFRINRTQKNLGYIHGVGIGASAEDSQIVFFGQTDRDGDQSGEERRGEIALGWEEVLKQIETKTLSETDFQDEKTGLIRRLSLLPRNANAALTRLAENAFSYKAPNRSADLSEIIPTLTSEEIYAVASKYLINQPYVETITSRQKPHCEGLLGGDLDPIREAIEGRS